MHEIQKRGSTHRTSTVNRDLIHLHLFTLHLTIHPNSTSYRITHPQAQPIPRRMAIANDLVLYRPSASSTALSATSASRSLALTSRLFNQTTGTAIATELLYRLIWDIINRLATHVHRFAAERLDRLGSFLEQRAIARQEARATRLEESEILKEVAAAREDSMDGFGIACPLTGRSMGEMGNGRRGGPPSWVLSVLKGAEEGRIESREFWINGLVG
jgi:hypothetical protein